jgi:beta-glucanase (GH16 family)
MKREYLHFGFALGLAALVAACASNETPDNPAGSGGSSVVGGAPPANGGTGGTTLPTGGQQSSGGGPSAGGSATGGTSSGGVTTGTGGTTPATGGKATGGAATGGTSTGGKATGGAATGGAPTGGKATGGAATGGSAGASCTSSSTGWNLVWSDEFNGPAGTAVDSSKWTFDVGGTGWGNSELEYYTSGTNNAAMDGAGNLVITAKKESQGGMSYTSARIKTQGIAAWTYGRVEGRIKIPQGQGLWPAFWLLGNDITTNPWPACGEIDVMENIGKEPSIIHGTIHGPGYSGGSGPTAQITLSTPVASAFHVFAIEWEQNVIRWYVDDTLYSTKTPSNIPSGATWVYAHPFFIILNVAVGGGWPGNPDSTTVFPQQMLVDYVRVCQR